MGLWELQALLKRSGRKRVVRIQQEFTFCFVQETRNKKLLGTKGIATRSKDFESKADWTAARRLKISSRRTGDETFAKQAFVSSWFVEVLLLVVLQDANKLF